MSDPREDLAALRAARRAAFERHVAGDGTCDRQRCCSKCRRHVDPHVGCILR